MPQRVSLGQKCALIPPGWSLRELAGWRNGHNLLHMRIGRHSDTVHRAILVPAPYCRYALNARLPSRHARHLPASQALTLADEAKTGQIVLRGLPALPRLWPLARPPVRDETNWPSVGAATRRNGQLFGRAVLGGCGEDSRSHQAPRARAARSGVRSAGAAHWLPAQTPAPASACRRACFVVSFMLQGSPAARPPNGSPPSHPTYCERQTPPIHWASFNRCHVPSTPKAWAYSTLARGSTSPRPGHGANLFFVLLVLLVLPVLHLAGPQKP